MKTLFTTLLLLISVFCYSQMDTDHWFAPMASNTPAEGGGMQLLYLSTASTDPVTVKVFSGNKLLGTTVIKKGQPTFYADIPRSQMIIEDDNEKMKVLSKGIHVTGDGNFYANYRFSIPDNAEMVTSKGRSALGKLFYLGMYKVKVRFSNNIAGVIATEDNTVVTLSNYEPSLRFTNDPNRNSTEKKVTLQKGESYIFEVDNINSNNVNFNGLIGAKIESTKPISVTCGNFLGGTNIGRSYFTDIYMDQTIPVEKIGTEYIVLSGNGNISLSAKTEKTLIVATEDNTQVFLNNNFTTTPDFVLPTPGSFRFIDSNLYQPSDAANNTYSLYVKTSKPSYVYQILAGSSVTDISSGAMNLIPPLSCLLPSTIGEISAVNENLTMSPLGDYVNNTVKLNIIAQKNSNLFVNGSKANILGPFPINGTLDWEAYTLPNAKGNVTVSTDNKKAVTVGIAGGSYDVGFGGYFAGFSVDPFISKIGECDTFKYLEVQDNFDDYEWYYSTDLINWTITTEKSNRINPGNNYGYYKCKVTKDFCPPSIFTEIFIYNKCTVVGPAKSYTLNFCENLSPIIKPEFSRYPTTPVDINKTKIKIEPEGGKAYVDNLGNIHYEPNGTTLNEVVFSYYFEGFGNFADSEEVTVTVAINQMKVKNVEQFQCIDKDGLGIYNLKAFEVENTDTTITGFQYFEDKNLTKQIDASLLGAYQSKPNTIIYVKVTNAFGCYRIGELSLKTYTPPVISVQVNGRSATISASGGLPPYLYAVENTLEFTNYQSSNVFNNLPIGLNTVYVLSSDKCTLSSQDFMITQLYNVITPNSDGYNDTLDYSEMSTKLNFSIKIYNRSGVLIYSGAQNNYIWDGKQNGVPFPTGTYWYVIQWDEPKTGETIRQTSYLLIKNRN